MDTRLTRLTFARRVWRLASRRLHGIWRRPDFFKLWVGQSVSVFGTLVSKVALPMAAVLLLHAEPAQIALLSAATVAPGLALGLFAGAIVDRLRRRPVMIVADIGRALALGSVPLAALLGRLTFAHLVVVALLVSALTVFFDSAYPAYLPSLLPRNELAQGNSAISASFSVAEVAGFGVAGALTQALTAPVAIGVDALTYIVSALTLGLIRQPERSPRASVETLEEHDEGQIDQGETQSPAIQAHRPRQLLREIAEGIRVALGEPLPRALIGSASISTLGGALIDVVLLLFMLDELHIAPALVGIIWGVGGATSFAGALLAQWALRRWGTGRMLIASLWIARAFTFLIPVAGGPLWLAVVLLAGQQLGDAAYTIYDITQTSVLQATIPSHLLGRLYATLNVAIGIATLAGLALGAALGQRIGLRLTLFVAAGLMALAPVLITLSPARRLK